MYISNVSVRHEKKSEILQGMAAQVEVIKISNLSIFFTFLSKISRYLKE